MKTKILITGGCGFIGSNLAIFLKEKKFKVNSLDNLSRKGSKLNLERLKKKKITNFKIDIKNYKDLNKLPKFDFIIDCSALVEAKVKKENITKVLKTNFLGTNNLILKSINDKSKFIFLSTSRVYSIKKINKIINNKKIIKKKIFFDKKHAIKENFSTSAPLSFYGLSKKISEDLILEYSYSYNLKYMINRFGVVSGPWQFGKVEQGFLSLWLWKHLRKLNIKYIGFGGYGNQCRDILHVHDLCDIIHKQIKKFHKIQNNIFNIGGGLKNTLSLKDVTLLSEKLTKNKIKIGKIAKSDKSDIPIYVSNNDKISKFYNWKPKRSILKIASDTYNWQVENFKILKQFMD